MRHAFKGRGGNDDHASCQGVYGHKSGHVGSLLSRDNACMLSCMGDAQTYKRQAEGGIKRDLAGGVAGGHRDSMGGGGEGQHSTLFHISPECQNISLVDWVVMLFAICVWFSPRSVCSVSSFACLDAHICVVFPAFVRVV